jgi:hypothetical protein
MTIPDAAMEAWIAEQMKYFPAGSMDGAVRLLRAYERADREREAAQAGAA